MAFPLKVNSIKFKFSVLYSFLLGLILVVFSTVLYAILAYYFYQNMDARLKSKAREVIATTESYLTALDHKPGSFDIAARKTLFDASQALAVPLFDTGKIKRLDTKWLERSDAIRLRENFVAFGSPDSGVTYKSRNFPSRLEPSFAKLAKTVRSAEAGAYHDLRLGQEMFRVIVVPFLGAGTGQPVYLMIAVSERPVQHVLNSLLEAMAWGIPLVLLLSCFVGMFFVQRVLEPIADIAKTATKITHGDLSARVTTRHLDEEIQYLADSFNEMISRLEKSFTHINDFSSQVAHELKTPLAIIKGEAELALSAERSRAEYQSTIRINLEEASRMRKTIDDLLLLARLDYQPEILKVETFDFFSFMREICEQSELLAAEKGHVIKWSVPPGALPMTASRLHLRRMLFNLVDNAIKYTLPPGEIRIEATAGQGQVRIVVADTGVGIAAQDLPRIFEKFYHFDRTGRNEERSTGLGLNIVHSILNIHKGDIQVTSIVDQGTTFVITLPTSPRP